MLAVLILLKAQLSFSMSAKCEYEWSQILMSIGAEPYSTNYSTMFQYSGFKLNQLGNYDSCNTLPDAKYVIVGFSAVPVALMSFCGPSVCTTQDYYEATYLLGEDPPPFEVFFPYEYQQDNYSAYTSSAVKMITLSSLLAFVCVACGLIDHFVKEDRESLIMRLILGFSLKENVNRLFVSRGEERVGGGELDFLNAVRVMSIGWVLLGHTYLCNMLFTPLNNLNSAFQEISDSKYILVYGSFYAVDTFFWLSGFFLAYLFLTDLEKSTKMNPLRIFKVYLHRVARILPVYMFCLFFFWTLQEYMGSGPMYFEIEKFFFDECEDYWWSNLLFINNIIPEGKGNGCFGVSWYLSVDMQLSLIAPIIVFLYARVNKVLGWVMISFFCAVSCISSGVVAEKYNMNVSAFSFHNRNEYMEYYYTKPYTRAAPYMLGVACGLIVFASKANIERGTVYDKFANFIENLQKRAVYRLSSFVFGVGLINILLFAQYDTYKYPGKDFGFTHWSKKGNYAFIAMERLIFGTGISLVMLPMLFGYFKDVKILLSGSLWNFIARLSFVIYLVHQGVIAVLLKSERDALTYRTYINLRDTLYFFFVSMALAIPIVLFIEMPLANLEKLFRGNTDLRTPKLLVSDNDSKIEKDSP